MVSCFDTRVGDCLHHRPQKFSGSSHVGRPLNEYSLIGSTDAVLGSGSGFCGFWGSHFQDNVKQIPIISIWYFFKSKIPLSNLTLESKHLLYTMNEYLLLNASTIWRVLIVAKNIMFSVTYSSVTGRDLRLAVNEYLAKTRCSIKAGRKP